MRKLLLLLAVVGISTAVGLVVHQDHAAAFYGCGIGYTYDPTHTGYFTGNKGSAPCNVLPSPALLNVTNTATFFSYMQDYLYQQNSKGENLSTSNKWIAMVGAAFIIDRMLGYPGKTGTGTGINYAKANFNVWKQRVLDINNNPSASVGINWNYTPSYSAFCTGTTNSAYSPDIGDDVFYPTTCPWDYNHSLPEIKIFWVGGSFEVGKQCGNVELTFSPLPADNPPTGSILSLDCDTSLGTWSATVTVSDPDAATTGYITVGAWTSGIVNSGSSAVIPIPGSAAGPSTPVTVDLYAKDTGPVGSGAYSIVDTAVTVPPCATYSCGGLNVTPGAVDPYMTFSVTVSVASSGPPPSGTMNLTVSPRAPNVFSASPSGVPAVNGQATFNNLGPTSSAGDKTGGRYDVAWSLGATNCTGTIDIVNLPYLNVYGGDVMTGSSPAYSSGASTCASNPDGGVYSWNNVGASFAGAGTQYAVQALGQIGHFASALSSSSIAPTGLSFANTGLNATQLNNPQGLFGGYFGAASGNCDFTSDLKASSVNADVTIGGHTVAAGTQEVHYITGHDVYISGNITYGGAGGWANVNQVPYFKLVVAGGDIYINSAVTQLDGIYVAESDAGTGRGRIFDCATAIRASVSPTAANYYSACKQKLTVNGVFVGKQVLFLRTIGTVGQAKNTDTLSSNHDAEVFNYTPEVWLPRGSGSPSGGYTAITGLPPVL